MPIVAGEKTTATKPRRVSFKQCDLERAIRAAQATGAGRVIVQRDGSIAIEHWPAQSTRSSKPDEWPVGLILLEAMAPLADVRRS